jgi:hypothetical protein
MFSDFGKGINPISAKDAIILGGVTVPVDMMSILYTVNSNSCEVLFKGQRFLLNISGIKVFSSIPKNFKKETYIAFRILREEAVGVTQIIVPFSKDWVSLEMFKSYIASMQ